MDKRIALNSVREETWLFPCHISDHSTIDKVWYINNFIVLGQRQCEIIYACLKSRGRITEQEIVLSSVSGSQLGRNKMVLILSGFICIHRHSKKVKCYRKFKYYFSHLTRDEMAAWHVYGTTIYINNLMQRKALLIEIYTVRTVFNSSTEAMLIFSLYTCLSLSIYIFALCTRVTVVGAKWDHICCFSLSVYML